LIEETKIDSSEVAGKFFSVGQITLATFLGMPIAGCLILARNYRVLGKDGAAWQSLGAGIVSTLLLFLIAFFLPENFPNIALPMAYCFGMRQLVQYLQGGAIDNHLKAGGRKGSWAITIAVGLGCLVIIFGFIFGLIMALNVE
jgi:hypothetical protein